jgi:AcrR family transcriptional regulator
MPPPPDPAPRRRRSTVEVRRALVDSAAAAFAANGYGGASTKEIARAAGTSETSIYRHFQSKAGLFTAAVAEPFAALLDEYRATFASQFDEPWDDDRLMREFLREFFTHLRARREAVIALLASAGDPDAADAVDAAADRLNEVFEALESFAAERARRVGGYSPEQADLWLRLLAGMVTAVAVFDRWFVPAGWEHRSDELLDVMADMALRGILASREK